MTDDGRFDFSALDPRHDSARFDRSVAAVVAGSAPELARRRASRSVLGQIAWWERPVLIAAAILGLAAISTLAVLESEAAPVAGEQTWSSAIGVPAHLTGWVERGQTPSFETAMGFATEAP
jgi:hypothetical protein